MLDKLNERERLFVLGGLGFVLLIGLLLGSFSLYKYRTNLTETLLDTNSQFTELEKIIRDYNYYRSIKSSEEENINQLVAKLEQIMKRHNLKTNTLEKSQTVIMERYNKTIIDVTMTSVKLEDVMHLIYDIEVNKQMNSKVEVLEFRKPLPGKEVYDVTIRFSSYSKKGKNNA